MGNTNYSNNVNVSQQVPMEFGLDLDIDDMFIFGFMATTFQMPQRSSFTTRDGTEYVNFKSEFVCQQLPLLKLSIRTVSRHIRKLMDAELISRHPEWRCRTYYCKGRLFDQVREKMVSSPEAKD